MSRHRAEQHAVTLTEMPETRTIGARRAARAPVWDWLLVTQIIIMAGIAACVIVAGIHSGEITIPRAATPVTPTITTSDEPHS